MCKVCKFNKAWSGLCEKDVVSGLEYCEEHSQIKCSICGKQATHDCGETAMLVCGVPLCDSDECKLQHYYTHHGYALDSVLDFEKKLGKTSTLVVAKQKMTGTDSFSIRHNQHYKDDYYLLRIVPNEEGTYKVIATQYRYKFRNKSEILDGFMHTWHAEEIKEVGLAFYDGYLYLDESYTKDTLPEMEQLDVSSLE